MNDSFLFLLFAVGGVLCVGGLGLHIIIGGAERFTRHCINFAVLGSGIAMPAVFPVLIAIGGGEYTDPMPSFLALGLIAIVCGINGYMIERKYRQCKVG
tara:strand:+ start:790 stop:1086 length:297 start_codon:yes stop_codon:yes gene_type:complete